MPPKPFHPPRPTGEVSTAKKSGRPRGSTNKKPEGSVTKPKSKPKSKSAKEKRISDAKRLSDAALRRLGSLSPDAEEESGSDIEMGDSDTPRNSIGKQKRKSTTTLGGISASEQETNDENDDDDPFSTAPSHRTKAPKDTTTTSPPPDFTRTTSIPSPLLTVLLHEFFKHKKEGKGGATGTRMTKEAGKAVGKYMDTFVREAVARAAWEGEERRSGGGGVLEVEDLERLGPQMLLDF